MKQVVSEVERSLLTVAIDNVFYCHSSVSQLIPLSMLPGS